MLDRVLAVTINAAGLICLGFVLSTLVAPLPIWACAVVFGVARIYTALGPPPAACCRNSSCTARD